MIQQVTIDDAPQSVDDIVLWLERLPYADFVSVWVSLAIERLADMSVRDANRILCCVRERYNQVEFRGRRLEMDEATLRRLYCDEGLSAAAVARKIGRSHGHVHATIKRMGIVRSLRDSMRFRARRT